MQWLPVLEIGLQSYLIDLFFGFAKDDGPAMATAVHVDEVCDDGVAMIVGAVEGQMLHRLGRLDLRILD